MADNSKPVILPESKRRDEQHIDEWMGNLLRAGVISAACIVIFGGILYLRHHADAVPNYREFQSEPADLKTISGIFRDAMTWNGRGFIQLGLLVLIATPVARVAFSVLAFLYERDWMYVCFTLVVLGLLCYSLFGGHG